MGMIMGGGGGGGGEVFTPDVFGKIVQSFKFIKLGPGAETFLLV